MKIHTASPTIYVQEELSNARVLCDELKHYINKALELTESSKMKDHFYGVAGDLMVGIPRTLLRLEKALESTAMAVNKIDYEEIKSGLKPDKVDTLERVLEEVRIKIPRRLGKIDNYDSDIEEDAQ
jgi:hypothetical protein